MCGTESRAREALRRIRLVMNRLGLTLHPAKTRLVDLRHGKESFLFLECMIEEAEHPEAPLLASLQRWPSPKATKKLRDRVPDAFVVGSLRGYRVVLHRGSAREARIEEEYENHAKSR
jgi:RNA-directed DNA polymerase